MSREWTLKEQEHWRKVFDVSAEGVEAMLDNSEDYFELETELQKGKYFTGSSRWTT